MKTFSLTKNSSKQGGYTLIEILVSIGVFALGALALAGLQTALTQSASNAKSRTTAVNIAQAEIERLRGFLSVGVNGDGLPAYTDVASTGAAVTSTVGGTDYLMTRVVSPHYWDSVASAFTEIEPIPAPTSSDFKKIKVTVGWIDPSVPLDQVDPTNPNQFVTLTDVISSLSTAGSGRVIAGSGQTLAPPVPYTPGARPEVAAIDLGSDRFKETLTPEPEVLSDSVDGQFVVTGFEVITFSQDPNDAEGRFLRREENRVLNCECTLNAEDAAVKTFQPMVWTGEEYVEGSLISKPYGIPASGRTQDPLCNICCQDHHDSATPYTDDVEGSALPSPAVNLPDWARFKYDPWAFSPVVAESSVHHHYKKNDTTGALEIASAGENYFESCRLIRSDGFFRVVQDVKLTDLVTVPEYYLSTDSDIEDYSLRVKEVVEEYLDAVALATDYPSTTPVVGGAGGLDISNTVPPTTYLPEPLNVDTAATSQQLRSRAVYIDYLTLQARNLYECLDSGGTDCGAPQIFSPLEVVPFFELNMTHLAEWNSSSPANVTITNERIPSGANPGTYSRGFAEKIASADVTATSFLPPSNTGLTNTDPVTPADTYSPFATPQDITNSGRQADLAISGSGTPPNNVIKVTGTITTQNGTNVDASQVAFVLSSVDGGNCQLGGGVYSCTFNPNAIGNGNGAIVVSNYNSSNKNNAACNDSGTVIGHTTTSPSGDDGTITEATSFNFAALAVGLTTMNILIKKNNSC